MKLQEILDITNLFRCYKKISQITRYDSNLIFLKLDDDGFFLNLNKSNPCIFISKDIAKIKHFNSPFDIALSKLVHKSHIEFICMQGLNKVIEINVVSSNSYKEMNLKIYIELMNYNVNFIITTKDIITQALHYNDRIIANKAYAPLNQPSFYKVLDNNTNIDSLKYNLENSYKISQEKILQNNRLNAINQTIIKKEKLEKLLKNLPTIKDLTNELNKNAKIANYILLNINSIKNYANSIVIDNISFDVPSMPKPQMLANHLFKITKKIKQKIKNLNLQIENIESKIMFLHNKIEFLKIASQEELEILKQKNINTIPKNATKSNSKFAKNKKDSKKQYETFYVNGIKICIGRNENENVKLLQDAKGDFYWLHLQNRPSSHLIIHSSKINDEILQKAGVLLARLCGINDKVKIDYTQRKFVKMTNSSNVVYSKQKTFYLQLIVDDYDIS